MTAADRLNEFAESLLKGQAAGSVQVEGGEADLVVTTDVKSVEGYEAVELVVCLTNKEDSDTPILSDIQALDASFALIAGDPVLHYARGGVCSMDDFEPLTRVMNPGAKVHLQPGGGRSSSDFLPFFNLELGEGQGVIFGIGWSGEWAADFERGSDGLVRVRIGQAHTHLRLHSGESIRTPLVLALFYEGGVEAGQNALRRIILEHYSPQGPERPKELPVFVGNWGGTAAAVHVGNLEALAEHDVPAGCYWIDAEWFGQGPWYLTVGDWRHKADLYPQGFRPIADKAHETDKGLLLWFEPERVCEDVPWALEHRKWLLEVPPDKRHYNWGQSQLEPEWVRWESERNQIREGDQLFNLAIPEAREFLTDFIAAKIAEYRLDWYRHDANIAPLEYWRHADAPDRQGMTEIRWVEGLYAFWDGLLERFPHLMIDNCASGGRRIDLEALSRSVPLWRTDHPGHPIGRQCHTFSIASWVPLNSTGGVNPAYDSAYDVRSAYSATLACGLFVRGDATQPVPPGDDYPFAQARAMLGEVASLRRYFRGDYYPLSCYSQAEDAWMAWQFHLPESDEGIVQAFRRPKSPHEVARYALRGLTAGATYDVSDLDGGEARLTGGEELEVRIGERPGAVVLVYRRVG